MHMSAAPATPPPDDDRGDIHQLRPKKEKKIEPLSSGSAFGIPEYGAPRADNELLEELRRKTAALAGEMASQHRHEMHDNTTADQEPQVSASPNDLGDKFLQDLQLESSLEQEKPTPEVVKDINPAISLVREKVARLYTKEPNAKDEIREVEHSEQSGVRRSKHQQFMYDLTTSGKSLAGIQTEWHNYYISLPDHEKHEVWQEFYEAQRPAREHEHHEKRHHHDKNIEKKDRSQSKRVHKVTAPRKPAALPSLQDFTDRRSIADIKSQLINKVNAGGQLTAVHHVKSLLFGIGMSTLVLLLITFVFFNEAYIAPFISPNQSVSATPIIGMQSGSVGPESKIIIPKINLEVPVVYGLNSINEADIQNALEDGVVHFASSPNPGEVGNTVIVGHSSNNILNKGKYKFAFVLLKRLEAEDTFFVQKDGVRYTYKVYKKEIVSPDNVAVLGTQDKPNTITLITCDPPGTSVNRLIITAEQIAPDPSGNKASTAPTDLTTTPKELPSNAPSLWSRIWPF